jgi:predicted nucleotidyltransferase component of viral defense system
MVKEINPIKEKELRDVSGSTGFNQVLIVKDYYITLILYLLKDVKGIYFKGGTALHKIFLNYSRLSEDVDYSLTRDVNEVKKDIIKIIENSNYFDRITKDKDVHKFLRLVVHYKNSLGDGNIFIDLNERGNLILKPEGHAIKHFYPSNIPSFSVPTLNSKEMFAEKMAATMGRNKPRDNFDMYCIIKEKIPLDLKLVEQKCKDSEQEFNIIKMFNKAKKLKNRWDEDMIPLLSEETAFQEVMKTLAKHFQYSEEKEKLKDTK